MARAVPPVSASWRRLRVPAVWRLRRHGIAVQSPPGLRREAIDAPHGEFVQRLQLVFEGSLILRDAARHAHQLRADHAGDGAKRQGEHQTPLRAPRASARDQCGATARTSGATNRLRMNARVTGTSTSRAKYSSASNVAVGDDSQCPIADRRRRWNGGCVSGSHASFWHRGRLVRGVDRHKNAALDPVCQ